MQYIDHTEDIRHVQNCIHAYGLQNFPELKAFMEMDPTEKKVQAQAEYYKNRLNKFYKRIDDNQYTKTISYMVVDDVDMYKSGSILHLNVIVSYWNFAASKTDCLAVGCNVERRHKLSTPTIGRFDDYIEISKEKFDNDMLDLTDGCNKLSNIILNK